MLRLALWLILALPLVGCHSASPGRDPHTIAPTAAEGEIDGRPTLGVPISIPGQSTLLVPYAIESRKWMFESRDPYSAGGISYEQALRSRSSAAYSPHSGGEVRWHNAIFHDANIGEEWMLLEQRGVVAQYQILGPPALRDEPFVSRALLFIVVLDDTNDDGVLNDLDARVAILADADGRNPRIVTPRSMQVWGSRYDHELDAVFLQVAADTDKDGRFSFEDLATPYVVSLLSRDPAAPLLSGRVVERANHLLQGARVPAK